MSNPLLSDNVFKKNSQEPEAVFSAEGKMTISGTINKSIILLILLGASAVFSWTRPDIIGNGLLMVALIAGFILAMVCCFKPNLSGIIAPIYAICEGVVLGCISRIYNAQYDGIVVQAVFLTIAVLFCMLASYRAGILRATPTFKRVLAFAMMGIIVFYLVNMIMGIFGSSMGYFQSNSTWAYIINIIIVIVAALNFIIDFDAIDNGVKYGAPKYMEWYCSFALMLTLIWLYIEILRLLSRRNN